MKERNKSGKNPNLAHTLFIKLFPLKAYKNAALMDYNSREQPFNHIVYKPKMILLFSFIIFYHKINFGKNINFSLYTLVQNLTFSKKANNSMKNSTRVTNNASNNRYFFALFVCNTNFKI